MSINIKYILFSLFFINLSAQLTINSPDFGNNQPIPVKFTCLGQNLTPVLSWTNAPAGTQAYAIIVDDPDAPTAQPFVHWVVYNIPGNVTTLNHSLGRELLLPDGTMQGINDFKRIGWDGPCPFPDQLHHYFFKIYALDSILAIQPGLTKNQLLDAMQGHILEQAELIGTFFAGSNYAIFLIAKYCI